jgi:peptide/nickel transport system substrate-binding protein
MSFFKTKIFPLWRRAKSVRWFSIFFKKKPLGQMESDQKLVYSLAPRKIPSARQLKHLKKFLPAREFLILKIAAIVFILSAICWGIIFIKNHLVYLPISGGKYVEGALTYPKNVNPLYATSRDIDGDLNRLIYSSLFRYNKSGRLENDLVESYTLSADGKEYLVKIKPGVKWHDGSDLTADDVIFTFNLIKDPDYRSALRPAISGAEIEKIDDYSVKFVLAAPYAPFRELLTFGILPKDIWDNTNPDSIVLSELNLKPIGSGPFKFKSLTKNKSGELKEYLLEANADYYGSKPYLKNIRFVFFADIASAVKALNDKQIMGLSYLPFASRPDLLAKNSLKINDLAQPQTVSLFFNGTKKSELANKDVRILLAKAINKSEIINQIFSGVYRVSDGPYLAESPAYNPDTLKYNYSPEEAVAGLKGKNLEMTLTIVDAGSNLTVAEKIKEYFAAAGVKLNIKAVSGDQIVSIIKDRDFEVLLYGQAVGGDPDIYAFWHSSQIGGKGLNLAGYSNPDLDKLLVEARTTANEDDRILKYKKAQEILATDLPVIFLYSPSYSYVQTKDLGGFTGTVIIEAADRFSDVSGWYLKTKKRLDW